MKRITPAILTVLVLLVAPAVWAQPSPIDALVERAREAGLDPEQVQTVSERAQQRGLSPDEAAQLIEPAVQLAEEDLPGEAVLGKALEGLAKGVPFTRIHPVVGQLQEGTREVGSFVSEWAQSQQVQEMMSAEDGSPSTGSARPVIEAAAQARAQGASSETIRSFLSNLPSETSRRPISPDEIASAVRVIPDVPGEGQTPESVGRFVRAALDEGVSPETMRQIPAALQTANRQTGRPIDALARSAATEMAAGTPASDVLSALFQGNGPGVGPPNGRGGPPEGTPPGQDLPPESGPPSDRPDRGGGNGGGPPGGGPPGDGGGSSGGGPPSGGSGGGGGS